MMATREKKSGTKTTATGIRRFVAAALLALLPAACASGDVAETGPSANRQTTVLGASLYGNYLAGRHAQAERDMSRAADYLLAALEKDPKNPRLLRRGFFVMILGGRMEKAVELGRRLDQQKAKVSLATIALAAHDIKGGRFDDGLGRLSSLSENGISFFIAPLLKAWTLVGQEKYDEALVILGDLLKKKGFKTLHGLHAALINDLAERPTLAEAHFITASETKNGLSLRPMQLMGSFYERTGKPGKAGAVYGKYLEQHPGSRLLGPALTRLESGAVPERDLTGAADGAAEALFGVAGSLRQQDAGETALVFGYLALYLRPDFPMAQIMVADLLESSDRLEDANELYASIRRDSPLAWSARLRRASNLNRLGRTDEAVQYLGALAKERPTDPAPLISLGDIQRSHENFTEAVEAYDQATQRIKELKPRHWSLLYSRGIALERAKQWPRAEEDFLKALEFDPNQPYVLNYLGYSWVEKGRNLDQALKMIEKAVSLRPRDGYFADSLGWVHYQLGSFPLAVRELERAIELRPQDAVINDHLGDAYWKVGRRPEARFQWKRALSLDPDPELISAIKEKLERGLAKTVKAGTNG